MRAFKLINSIMVIWLLIIMPASFAAKSKVLNIQNWQTANGAAVYFVRLTQLPMLDIQLAFAAGSAYDGKHYGLAAMTENMLGQATSDMNADQIAEVFDDTGAEYNTDINRDMALIGIRTLTKAPYFSAATKIFTHILHDAKFPQQVLTRVQNLSLTAIRNQQQDPGQIAEKQFYQMIFPHMAYGHPVEGTLDSVKAITTADAEKFFQRYYVAKNVKIILVGDITLAQAKELANQLSQALPTGAAADTLKMAQTNQAPQFSHINYPAQQTSIILGQVGISRDNPDYFPLLVGNYVFGGAPLTSILFKEVRNKRGLSYSTYSGFIPLKFRGPFVVTLKTRNDKVNAALTVIKEQLHAYLQQGPTSEQLDAAKANLISGFPLEISNNSKILGVLTSMAFYNRPLDYLDKYVEHVKNVTTSQVQHAFQKTLDLKNLSVVTVGPG